MKTYTATWTEVSHHERNLTAEELADLLGVEVDELDDIDGSDMVEELADALADLEDDGFQGLVRRGITVAEHNTP